MGLDVLGKDDGIAFGYCCIVMDNHIHRIKTVKGCGGSSYDGSQVMRIDELRLQPCAEKNRCDYRDPPALLHTIAG